MIRIDLPADLHFEDDEGNNLARLTGAAEPARMTPGAVLVAGSADAWTWAQVVAVADGWVHYRQLTTAQAAALANLVEPLSATA